MKRFGLLGFTGRIYQAEDRSDEELTEFMDILHRAREEWLAAENYFDNVNDPDLVDYAIYDLEAARRKYIYLIKQARARGIKIDVSL